MVKLTTGWAAGQVPELVERRRDGLWYTVRRFGNVDEYAGMHRWIEANHPEDHMVRWVDPASPYLSASYYWAEQKQVPWTGYKGATKVPDMMTEDKARLQGSQLAQAFCAVFQINGNGNAGQVYSLARTLANLSDKFRDDVDIYEAFTAGFLQGWQSQPARIVAPSAQE